MIRKIPVLIILLSAVSLIFSVPQPFRFICGFLQVFVLPGLIFSYLFLGTGFSRTDRSFFSILISPILISLMIIAVTVLTGDIYSSVKVTLAMLYFFLVAIIVLRRKSRAADDDAGMPWQVLAVAFIFAGIILFSYLYNSFLLLRSDSWYHASVINEVAKRGIPPMEPWLADFPIKYMWLYHLFNAVWMKLSGLPLFWAMGIFNVVTAFVFPYLIARYISCFTDKKYLIISASILALAGLESVSWIMVPVGLLRTMFGEVRGMVEIQRMLSAMVINGSHVIHTLTPYGSWMVNLYDKFITVTAFSYSLNLFLGALILVLNRRFLLESRVRASIAIFTLVLGAILFHAVTGTALVMTIIGACILLVIFGRYLLKDTPGFEVKYIPMAAAFLAAVLSLPYVLSLGGGAGGEGSNVFSEHLHLGIMSIITIALPMLVLFFPARTALRKLIGRRDYRAAVLICWSVALLMIAIVINLPTVNDSKLIFPLFLIIGPPIYIEIIEKIRGSSGLKKVLIVFSVIMLFFVPPVLTFRGFIIQRADTDIMLRRDDITADDKRFFEWIRKNTPDDALIIENNSYHLVPVFADRRNLYSTQGVIRVLGYGGEKMEMYGKIQASLFGEDGFSEETILEMGRIDSKLYIALWRVELEACPWLSARFSEDSKYFKQVFASDRVSLYTLRDDLD